MSFGPGAVVLRAGEGKTVPVTGSPYTFKATSADTRSAYVAIEITAVGAPPPLHVHNNAEEAFYVLDGEVTAQIGDNRVHAGAGAFVLIPRGTPHTFMRAGETPPRLLVVISPPGVEGFFEVVDARFPPEAGPPDPTAIGELAARYDIHTVGPPPVPG